MRNGRARRLVAGLGLGYLHTASAVLIGLWLTPFLLRRLGAHDYGLWLLGAQVLFYLALLDLGIVALVPRDIAGLSGLPNGDRQDAIRRLIGQTVRVVVWQLPGVAAIGAAVVWLLPPDWAPLRGPLAIVIVGFVAAFPFRIAIAVLQGLQDLGFVGSIQLASWAAGTAVTIGGVVCGLALYSLPLGWVATQVVSALLSWLRLRATFADMLPRALPSLTLTAFQQQFGRGGWISVSQVAQVLVSGTDLVVIGKVLGPEAVVPYACTGKLVALLANQPQMFMQLALPALSELRVSASRARLFDITRSMTQLMLLGSGAIAVVVLAANEAFVGWWVGEGQFGGADLTVLLLAGMLCRHLNTTAVYALFCFGNERRLALTAVADGVAGTLAMLLLVPVFGLRGAALGPLLATCCVSLPCNLTALAREQGASPMSLLAPLGAWAFRLALLATCVAAFGSLVPIRGLGPLLLVSTGAAAAYLAIMVPVLRSPPLGSALQAGAQSWSLRGNGFVRWLTGQSMPLNPTRTWQ